MPAFDSIGIVSYLNASRTALVSLILCLCWEHGFQKNPQLNKLGILLNFSALNVFWGAVLISTIRLLKPYAQNNCRTQPCSHSYASNLCQCFPFLHVKLYLSFADNLLVFFPVGPMEICHLSLTNHRRKKFYCKAENISLACRLM